MSDTTGAAGGKRSFVAMATGRSLSGRRRVDWVDTAKAVSILMVVAWHVHGRSVSIAPVLIFVPMPLFFFIAGFFARKSVSGPWRDFGDSEGARLLYLYVLWTAITFMLVSVPDAIAHDEQVPWVRLASLLTSPFLTLWFAYALALTYLLAKLFARVPPVLTATLLAVLYSISVAKGVWFRVPFIDQLVRLAPFFFAGVLVFPRLNAAMPRLRNWWPVVMVGYLVFAWMVLKADLAWLAPLTFAASLLGITAMLMMSAWLQRFPAALRPINFLGASTFCIYVLHRIVLFYWGPVQKALDLPQALQGMATGVVVIAACLLLGTLILRFAPWMFHAPWRSKEERPSKAGKRVGSGARAFRDRVRA